MRNDIVKVYTKADELKARTAKVNSDGSFVLPWGNQPTIDYQECYKNIIPFLEDLKDAELKEIYLKLQHHTYAGIFVGRHALTVLNSRGVFFNAVKSTFHKCSL